MNSLINYFLDLSDKITKLEKRINLLLENPLVTNQDHLRISLSHAIRENQELKRKLIEKT